MPLEVACPSCEGKFRVPDSAAGKKIRCPKCKGAIEVPVGESAPEPAAPVSPVPVAEKKSDRWAGPPLDEPATKPTAAKTKSSALATKTVSNKTAPKPAATPTSKPKVEKWFLKTEDGESFGPVPKEELDDWKTEGRITAECQLLKEGSAQWQWAADLYPDLDEAAEEPAPTSIPTPKASTTAKKGVAKAPPEPEPEPEAEIPSFGAAVEQDDESADEEAPEEDEPAPVARKSKARRSKKAVSTDEEDDEPSSSRSKAIAGLLGIFLGPVGAHRFYLGYWGLGIAMLLTGGGCGIWSLIDGIFILLGKVSDADGRELSD